MTQQKKIDIKWQAKVYTLHMKLPAHIDQLIDRLNEHTPPNTLSPHREILLMMTALNLAESLFQAQAKLDTHNQDQAELSEKIGTALQCVERLIEKVN